MIGFRKSHAVVIGIDEYGQGIPRLRTAVNDARSIAQVLESVYGYTVRLLTEDVSLAHLKSVFEDDLLGEVQAEDRVLVYFAGHGIALDGDDGPAGYLVPQDACRQDRDSFLPMADLNRWLEKLPCRHMLLVLDCCFAGAYRWSTTRDFGDLPEVIHRERFDRYIKDPAWQVITSAAYDQKALDVVAGEILGSRGAEHGSDGHSPFALAFLRALEEGEADLIPRGGPDKQGGDGVITATELYLYLRECVETGAEADSHLQTPGLWPLKKHDKGEYIHLVPGHALNLPPAPALDEANNPWQGLRSYEEEQAHIFFGRSRFVEKLVDRVRAQPLTVVLGSSGTGKSSVVKAGLIPHLRAAESDDWHIFPPIRPGKSPLASLASLSLPGEVGDDLNVHLAEFWVDPEVLANRVANWVGRQQGDGRLLLIIDQFEELITLCCDAGEREEFLQLLERALVRQPDRLRVVLTLRSDFEPQFARSFLEDRWMASRVVVPAMTLDEYRETIEGPASVKVLYFQSNVDSQAFINRLIGDVANTPGALPLLSFTLSELYRRYLQRRGEDRALCENDYEALGGVGGSLRNRAEEVYIRLTDDATRDTMQRVMLRMISVETGEIARRHVPDTELVYREPAENSRVAEVLGLLIEARLVVKGKETDDEPFVEPAHDELVRGWDRLLAWSRQEQEWLLLRRILTPAADDWKRGAGGLWHTNPRLSLVRRVLDSPKGWLNQTEADFVSRSVLKRRRLLASTISAVSLAFVVLSVITLIARYEQGRAEKGEAAALKSEDEAKAQTLISQRNERIATSRQLAILSTSNRINQLDLSLLLAVEAHKIYDTDEARDSLYSSIQNHPEVMSFLNLDKGKIASVAFSPDGKTLAVGHRGGVVLLDVDSHNPLSKEQFFVKEGDVSSVAFSSDGKTIAVGYERSGNQPGGIVFWDVNAHKRLVDGFSLKSGSVKSVSFSQDGSRIAVGCESNLASISNVGGVVLLNAVTGKRLNNNFFSVKAGVTSVTFSPDGKSVAASYSNRFDEGGVVIWDAIAGNKPREIILPVVKSDVSSVAFSPDGMWIAVAFNGFGRLQKTFLDPKGSGVMLLSVTEPNRSDGEPLFVKEGDVSSVAFSPDGKTIAAGYSVPNGDAGVILMSVTTGKRLVEVPFLMKKGNVSSVTFSRDGKTIAAGHRAGVVLLDIIARNRLIKNAVSVKEGIVSSVAISRDGKNIAAGYKIYTGEGGLVLWCPETGERFVMTMRKRFVGEAFPEKELGVNSIAFSPDGKTIAAGYGHFTGVGCVVLWDVATHEQLGEKPLLVKEGIVSSVVFDSDGKTLAAAYSRTDGFGGGVVLLNVAARSRLDEKRLAVREGNVSRVVFSPDGKTIAATYYETTGNGDNGVMFWNVESRKRFDESPFRVKGARVSDVAFTPDGRTVAAGYRGDAGGGGVALWDVASRKQLHKELLSVPDGSVYGVACSRIPDGKTIIAAAYRGANVSSGVVLWDVESGRRFIEEPIPVGAGDIAFSQDGKSIAASIMTKEEWEVVQLDVDLDSWRGRAGQIVNRNFTLDEWRVYFPDKPYRRTFLDLPDGEGVDVSSVESKVLKAISPLMNSKTGFK